MDIELPPLLERPHYATRNNAFTPPVNMVLDGANLRIEDGQGPPRTMALRTVAEVQLEFAPTRPEPNRFRCRLVMGGGKAWEFYNRTYRGVMDFSDTSEDYAAFVKALHASLARHSPGCRFRAGVSAGLHALNIAILILVGMVLVGAMIFFISVGLVWIALIKVLLIVFYLPTALRWVKCNQPRTYTPASIPTDLLPRLESESAPGAA